MLKRPLYGALGAVLLVLESLAVAGFVWLEVDPRRHLLSLGLLALTAAAILALLISLGARVLARRTGRTPSAFTPALAAGLSPLVLLGLVFLQFVVFLRDLRPVLPWLSVLGSFYLLGASVSRALASAPRPEGRRDRGPRPKTLFAVSFLVYAFLASGLILPPQPFSGDEPHYLLITQSLLADGDIDVYNDYRLDRYRALYPGPLENHAFSGKEGPDHEYSRHLPGTSILVLPSYLAGELVAKALAPGPEQSGLRRADPDPRLEADDLPACRRPGRRLLPPCAQDRRQSAPGRPGLGRLQLYLSARLLFPAHLSGDPGVPCRAPHLPFRRPRKGTAAGGPMAGRGGHRRPAVVRNQVHRHLGGPVRLLSSGPAARGGAAGPGSSP